MYILLCYLWPGTAGELGAFPVIETADRRYLGTAAAHTGGAVRAAKRLTPLLRAALAVAILTLLVTLLLPLRVFMGGSDPAKYAANMEWYKRWLIVATVIYFIAATYWEVKREEQREGT